MNFDTIELNTDQQNLLSSFSLSLHLETAQAKRALEFFARCCILLDAKQKDYGTGNISKAGHAGVLTRMTDKVERLKNLEEKKLPEWLREELERISHVANDDIALRIESILQQSNPKNESVVDSLLDLANYAAIDHQLQENTWEDE